MKLADLDLDLMQRLGNIVEQVAPWRDGSFRGQIWFLSNASRAWWWNGESWEELELNA